MIGDIVFFKNDYSFISRMISYMTKSEFTHVGLIVAYDEVSNVATVIESDRFVNTRLTRMQFDENHAVYGIDKTKEQEKIIVKFAHKSLGKTYDYLQILGIFISLIFKGERYFNSKNKYICSELIDRAYVECGIKRNSNLNIGNLSPKELLEVYSLKKR